MQFKIIMKIKIIFYIILRQELRNNYGNSLERKLIIFIKYENKDSKIFYIIFNNRMYINNIKISQEVKHKIKNINRQQIKIYNPSKRL